MKMIALLTALWFASPLTHAQTGAGSALESAVNRLDNARTLPDFRALGNDFTRVANAAKTDWLAYYYAAYCTVRLAYLNQNNPDNVEPYSDEADGLLQKAQTLSPTNDKKAQSELACLWSMVNRSRVFARPLVNGLRYGKPANEFRAKAQQLDPQNPRAMYLAAYEKFAAPVAFGGDKEGSRTLLRQALTKLDQQPGTGTAPRWGKADCEALLKRF